jgi:HTH-type transcriptional regulator/antitoxin HigA
MIKPIRSKKQYKEYLDRAYKLMQKNLKAKSADADQLELLSILIEKYELEKMPIDPPHPIEAIKFRLDQLGLKKSVLSEIFGSRSRVSEVFSGKRKLSLSMIRALNKKLDIPAEILIKDYSVEAR